MKPKPKKSPQVDNNKKNSANLAKDQNKVNKPKQNPNKNEKVNGNATTTTVSYASVAAANEQPHLMSPMVFAGQNQQPQPQPPPLTLPGIIPPMNLSPANGTPMNPLTQEQLIQVLDFLHYYYL